MKATVKRESPILVQAFDVCEERVYYKLIDRLFGLVKRETRRDRMSDWVQLEINWETPPDKILVNGKECEIKFK